MLQRLSPDKIQRLTDCLLAGMSSRAAAKAVPCALNTVTKYRRALNFLCGCGQPASHFGGCAYRASARTPSNSSCECGRPSNHAGLCRVRIGKMARRERAIVDLEDPRIALLEARCDALERRVKELEAVSKPTSSGVAARAAQSLPPLSYAVLPSVSAPRVEPPRAPPKPAAPRGYSMFDGERKIELPRNRRWDRND
jgi:hypothetical protein